MWGANLQDQAEAQEQARIQARRDANERRRQVYLNAKKRLIGVDLDGLNQQVYHKQQQKQREEQERHEEYLRQQEILRLMEEAENEERRLKQQQWNSMKQDWEADMNRKAELARQPTGPDYDRNSAGPSSALYFSGEDLHRNDRIKAQHEQLRRWVEEQIAEKAQLREWKRQEDLSFEEMEAAVRQLRAAIEEEERQLRAQLEREIREENAMRAREYNEWNRTYNRVIPNPGEKIALSLDLFNENPYNAYNQNGRVVRRDMFKGFTPEQQATIYQQNKEVAIEASRRRQQEREDECDWALHQLNVLRHAEAAEAEAQYQRKQMEINNEAYLINQAHENRYRRRAWDDNRFGEIDHRGIYDGFGKSCR